MSKVWFSIFSLKCLFCGVFLLRFVVRGSVCLVCELWFPRFVLDNVV